MTRYAFSTAATLKESDYNPHEWSWGKFVKALRLNTPADHKDCGNIVGGLFKNNRRNRENLLFRTMLSIDADEVSDHFVDIVEMELDCAVAMYTTWRHQTDGCGNRWRVWAPLSRKVSPEEYWLLCHAVMWVLGDGCDKGSAEPERLMHCPSTQDEVFYQYEVLEGAPLDVDHWLAVAESLEIPARGERVEPDEDLLGDIYDLLDDNERQLADLWVQNKVRYWTKVYEDALELGEDERDDSGRGWEALARDGAWAFAVVAAVGWSGVGVNEAESLYMSVLPEQIAQAEACGDKWYPGLVDRVREFGEHNVAPPWETSAFTALDDEDPEEPENGPEKGDEYERATVPKGLWVTAPSGASMDVARDLLKREGRPRLVWWRGDWWQWVGHKYRMYDTDELKRWLYLSLEKARYVAGNGNTMAWNPGPASVAAVMDAMKALLLVDENLDQPSWLRNHQPGRWLSHGGGIMNLDTRETIPHTRDFFTGFSVPFRYEPDAPQPLQWERFLIDVLPEPDQRLLLQQWFGYCLSGRVDLEKALLMIGPKRGGKGTIATVLTALLGVENVTGPNISSLASDFGLQPLVGKSLAVVGDARMGEGANRGATEKLLGIIGRDIQNVNRKGKDFWVGVLPVRFVIMTNEMPHFEDSSGAIMSRFVMLTMRRSFEGREDTGLKDRLRGELAGIFNWALEGLDMLTPGAKLIEPAGSAEARRDMYAMSSPITVWAEEACVFDPESWTSTQELYSSYKFWADTSGYPSKTVVHFARALRAAFPQLLQTSPRYSDEGYVGRGYQGIAFAEQIL